ncbi:syntaxin-112 [Mercurialis annua]|uniref:syntaxin-112 n=1 Tax=Mercurialis annua TaxID=3986 RepID=UPI00215E83FC|nr:syntaxin-112 [Mercurialis annua]
MNDLMTKSFLSYVDLKKQAQMDLQTESDLESGHHNPTSDDPNLSQFFQEVDAINAEMEEITSLLSDLQALDQETKSTHSNKVLRGLRDRIESNITAVLRKAKIVKARLESMDRSNQSNRKISYLYRQGSPIDRTRITLSNGLRVKFREIMNEFQVLRDKILSDYRNDLKRRYFTATGEDPSEEMIDKIVSGSVEIRVFEGKLEGKERHEAVMDIRRSLTKLQNVFLDMGVLVETQGEKLNEIEENVGYAGNFISGGTDSLYYAKQMKNKNKVLVFWVWYVLLVILLVCIVGLLAS